MTNYRWQQVALDEISDIKGGKRLPKGEKYSSNPTPYRYIRVSDMGQIYLNEESVQYIPEHIYKLLNHYRITSNDVYLSIAGTIGKVGQIPDNLSGAILTENACKLVITGTVDKFFLSLMLNSPDVQKQIVRLTKKMGQPKLALFRAGKIKLNLPFDNDGKISLDEQRRIANKLSSLFSEIDKAIEETTKALDLSQRLLLAELKIIFEKENDGWTRLAIDKLADIFMGQSPPSSTYNAKGDGLPFYQGKADFGETSPTPRVYCTKPTRIAEVRDILISVRAPVGPINICAEKSGIGRGLAIIRPKNTEYRFLYYFFKYLEPKWEREGRGAVFSSIGKKELFGISIPTPINGIVPNITKQKEVVSHLDNISKLASTLILKQQQNLDTLSLLKQSLLNQAFMGKL